MIPLVGICFGTYQRLAWLQACLDSLRWAVGQLPYRIYIADGGSTDGTLPYLREQADVHLIEQGELLGAVAGFDAAYEAAIDDGSEYPTTFNDDLTADRGGPPIIAAAVRRLEADETLGGVAFASDRYRTPQAILDDPFAAAFLTPGPRVDFDCGRHHGRAYMNQGVARRAAHLAVARAQGDPTGRDYWDRRYHTYGADSAAGCWMWRLGWRIAEAMDLRVHEHVVDDEDLYPGESGDNDPLRQRNMAQFGATAATFAAQWGDPSSVEYHREDAIRFGGRLL